MAIYTVKNFQNIFDIAIQLYGSIEGIYDLLISNPTLSMNTDLIPGMELQYHDFFVINEEITKNIKDSGKYVANGERSVYHKNVSIHPTMLFNVEEDMESVSFNISGSGEMIFDWGDNSQLETISLLADLSPVAHNFNNKGNHMVKVYGSFEINAWDVTFIPSQLFVTKRIPVNEFASYGNNYKLDCLFLFDNTSNVDLKNSFISDLSPIKDMQLQVLDLRGVNFQNGNVLKDYLSYLADHCADRPACTIYLSTTLTKEEYELIDKVMEANIQFVFNINDNIYVPL